MLYHSFPVLLMLAAVVQLLSHVLLSVIPRTAAHQASPSFTISGSFLYRMPAAAVVLPHHLLLCRTYSNVPFLTPGIRHGCLFSFFPSSSSKMMIILLIFSRNHWWFHLNFLIGFDRQIFPRDLNSKKRSYILIPS